MSLVRIIILPNQVYYQFFQKLPYMIATPRRQQYHKLTALPPNSFSPKAKPDQSSAFLHYHPNIIISNPYNARPPTPNHKIERPPNVFIRRVKPGSTRVLKSKTDHMGYNQAKQRLSQQKYHLKQSISGKIQSLHRASSAKSFLIRKTNTSSSGKRPQTPSVNCQVEFQSLQKQLMNQIIQNSQELKRKFCNQSVIEKKIQSYEVKQQKNVPKDNKQKEIFNELQNTIVSQKFEKVERQNVLELLQTKKSSHYSKNQSKNIRQNASDHRSTLQSKPRNEKDKQNSQHFPQKCIKFDAQSSNHLNNYNQYLRKQDRHKSHKQFDRRGKVNSACRIVKVPWAQIQGGQPESPKLKLKRQRLQYKKQHQQVAEHKFSELFGGISMIASKGLKNSINCGMPTQSLRDLCNQLQLQRIE